MFKKIAYDAYHFGLVRIIFALYLFVFFTLGIEEAPYIYSKIGFYPKLYEAPFPNIFLLFSDQKWSNFFFAIGSFLSILFALGFKRRFGAFCLYYLWACIHNISILTPFPHVGYVGWLLIIFILVPEGEGYVLFKQKKKNWNFPSLLFWGTWVIVGISYTSSGFYKFDTISWVEGNAVESLLKSYLANSNSSAVSFMINLPHFLLKFFTYATLAIQVFSLALIWSSRGRCFLNYYFFLSHTVTMISLYIRPVSIALLIFHFMFLEPIYFQKVKEGFYYFRKNILSKYVLKLLSRYVKSQ